MFELAKKLSGRKNMWTKDKRRWSQMSEELKTAAVNHYSVNLLVYLQNWLCNLVHMQAICFGKIKKTWTLIGLGHVWVCPTTQPLLQMIQFRYKWSALPVLSSRWEMDSIRADLCHQNKFEGAAKWPKILSMLSVDDVVLLASSCCCVRLCSALWSGPEWFAAECESAAPNLRP